MPQDLTQATERDDTFDDLSPLSDVEIWQRYGPFNASNTPIWILCGTYSFLVLFSVLATGNHFWLDAVAGIGAGASLPPLPF